jgi:hypothetical protein
MPKIVSPKELDRVMAEIIKHPEGIGVENARRRAP